jgi:hypothetical protein
MQTRTRDSLKAAAERSPWEHGRVAGDGWTVNVTRHWSLDRDP